MITGYDVAVLVCVVVVAICLGLLGEVLPKHIRWVKENRNKKS